MSTRLPQRLLAGSLWLGCFATVVPGNAQAQKISVYQGPVRLPDFAGRDREYANYSTRIRDEMRTGPNFAGRYALIEMGCGTSCRFVFVANVATGQVYDFPYGGEKYYMLDLRYNVKSDDVVARWISDDRCMEDNLTWNGAMFKSTYKRVVGSRSVCEAL